MMRTRVDDILEEAYGETIARLIAGGYRLADAVARLTEQQQGEQATAPAEGDTSTESEVSDDGIG